MTVFPLSACSVPKEVSAEASEAHVVTANMCCLRRCPWFCLAASQGYAPFSIVFVPDLMLGHGVECASVGGQHAVAAGIKVVVLLPETRNSSILDVNLNIELSQGLSTPDPAPNCIVRLIGLETTVILPHTFH